MLCERILQTVTIYIYSYSDTQRKREREGEREREREKKAVFLIQETKQLEREKPRKISCKAEEISCQRKKSVSKTEMQKNSS